jgi:hypothetical protein
MPCRNRTGASDEPFRGTSFTRRSRPARRREVPVRHERSAAAAENVGKLGTIPLFLLRFASSDQQFLPEFDVSRILSAAASSVANKRCTAAQ